MLITMGSYEVMSLVMNLRSSIAFWFLVVLSAPVCGLPCPFNATTGTIDLSSQNLKSLTNLTFITVYNCSGLFGNTSSMDLSHNSIMSMDADTFSKWYELTALNLSHNRLADIEHSTFLSLLNLQSLDLSHNSLTQLRAGVIDLISLQTVTFENNSIIYVEAGIVNQIHENLIYFNLNYNLLTSLDAWPYLVHYGGRQQDKVFDIQHNNISDITNTIGWTYDLIYPYEIRVNIQHNNIKTVGRYIFERLGMNITDGSVDTILLSIVGLNFTHNPFLCDCRLYDFSISLRDSIFRWSRVDEYRLRCTEPSSVAGVDWLHDLPLDSFICNVTSQCPSVCSCQDRPHNDTFHIDCSNAGLTYFPDLSNLSLNGRSKLELNLDYNYLTIIPYIFHIDKLYNISLRYNNIEKISTEFIKNATILNRLDLRGNKIRALPREIQRYNYRTVYLSGNPLWCDCDTLWLSEWASTEGTNGDNSLHCDSAKGIHALVHLTEDLLDCIDRRAITVFIVVGVIVSMGIVISVVIVKCPYDAKVILRAIFRTHPWEQYKIDEDAEKVVDIYLIFDEKDHDVVGFVDTILTQRIEKLEPIYNIVNPEKVYLEADELIRKSKRVLIVLSENLFVNENKLEEIKQADRNVFEAIANQRAYQESVVEDEDWIKSAARIIYIKYNNSRPLTISLNEKSLRSWLTCSKYRRFLDTSHRLFWRQLRYELPPTGCGVTRGKFSQSMSRRGANPTVTIRNNSSSNRGTHNQDNRIEAAGYADLNFDQLCNPSGSSVISRIGIDSRQSEILSMIECDSVIKELSSQSLRVINEVLIPESHGGGTAVTNKRVHAVSPAQLLLHVKACSDLNV